MERNSCVVELKNVAVYHTDGNSRSPKSEDELVLSDVNLRVNEGEMVYFIGRVGSGKSTLAKLMNGILTPESGKVTVYGMDTSMEENLLPIRRKVGIVFQNPDNQLVASIVEEDVAFGPMNLGLDYEEVEKRVDEALEMVGMKDYKTVLQEKLQENGQVLIEYTIIKEQGPDHNKFFVAEVTHEGKLLGKGSGKSKKEAEQNAANHALEGMD